MTDVVHIVNDILSKAKATRAFTELMDEIGSANLVYHCEVRWLSRVNVLRQVWMLTEELLFWYTTEEDNEKKLSSVIGIGFRVSLIV